MDCRPETCLDSWQKTISKGEILDKRWAAVYHVEPEAMPLDVAQEDGFPLGEFSQEIPF